MGSERREGCVSGDVRRGMCLCRVRKRFGAAVGVARVDSAGARSTISRGPFARLFERRPSPSHHIASRVLCRAQHSTGARRLLHGAERNRAERYPFRELPEQTSNRELSRRGARPRLVSSGTVRQERARAKHIIDGQAFCKWTEQRTHTIL